MDAWKASATPLPSTEEDFECYTQLMDTIEGSCDPTDYMSGFYGILVAECKDIIEGNEMYNGRLDVIKARLDYECTKE